MKLNLKILISLLFLLISKISFSQTVVYSDNMEDTGWTWKGVPRMLINSYYTGGNSGTVNFPNNSDYFSSSDSCFVLFGTGLGSSSIERDTLSYLNVTGLDPNSYYRFKVKVASFALSPFVNTAAGVDNTDYIQIDYSSDGGLTFFKEMRLTGSNNRRWSFAGGISLGKVANGTLNTFTSIATSIYVDLPLGITQFAGNIILVCNAIGESWMIDDVELIKVTSLPIELMTFEGKYIQGESEITWITASELNNDYFNLLRSLDGENYSKITTVRGAGTTSMSNTYNYQYKENCLTGILYYKLQQIDFDGTLTEYGPIALYCRKEPIKEPIKTINILGELVDENYEGLKITIFNDGTTKRSVKILN